MSTTADLQVTVKRISSANRIAAFKNAHCVPFTGTNKNPYNLENIDAEASRPTEDSIIDNLPTLEEYLKNRKTPVVFGLYDVVCLNKDKNDRESKVEGIHSYGKTEILFIDKESNYVYRSNDGIPNHRLTNSCKNSLTLKNLDGDCETFCIYEENYPSGLDCPVGAVLSGNTLLINADEDVDENNFIRYGLYKEFPCLSFSCLANLCAGKVVTSIKRDNVLNNLNVKVLDFYPEETRNISPSLQATLTKARTSKNFNFLTWASDQTPPVPGFSLVDTRPVKWHKSSTVLIRNGKKSYLTGQDEGTYFGCSLADNPNNIKEAHISLMPKEARGAKGVIRQGEWFAIPVKNQKSVPDQYSNDVIFCSCEDHRSEICFGLESEESNHHHFEGTLMITKDGRYFAKNFSIEHNQHASMVGKDHVWYTFARNTAVMSFSAENVD